MRILQSKDWTVYSSGGKDTGLISLPPSETFIANIDMLDQKAQHQFSHLP